MNQPPDPDRTVDETPRQSHFADGFVPQETAAPARLELLEEIARGGMGAIFRGRDADIGRDVAVKVLLEDHRGRPELAQRFLEEARIAGRLQHPGVVPVYALGRMPDGRPYFTMKLIKGRTLTALLAERKDPADRPAAFPGGLRAGVPDAGLRPRPRRHPPGPQAGQRHGGGLWRGAGDGLGPGQGAAARRRGGRGRAGGGGDGGGVADPDATGRVGHGGGRDGDAGGQRDGDAGLHGAGAGPRRDRGRGGAFGCVRAGRDPVRGADGPAAVRGAERGGVEAGAAGGSGGRPRPAGRLRGGRGTDRPGEALPGGGSGGSAGRCRRGRGGGDGVPGVGGASAACGGGGERGGADEGGTGDGGAGRKARGGAGAGRGRAASAAPDTGAGGLDAGPGGGRGGGRPVGPAAVGRADG